MLIFGNSLKLFDIDAKFSMKLPTFHVFGIMVGALDNAIYTYLSCDIGFGVHGSDAPTKASNLSHHVCQINNFLPSFF